MNVIWSDIGRITEDIIDKRYPCTVRTRRIVATELASSFLAFYRTHQSGKDFSDDAHKSLREAIENDAALWLQMDEILSMADDCVDATPANEYVGWRLRQSHSVGNLKQELSAPNAEAAGQLAHHYTNSPWAQSPALELWLARMLTFAEVDAFARQVAQSLKPSKLDLSISIGLYVVASVASIEVGERYGGGMGLTVFAIWIGLFRFKEVVKLRAHAPILQAAEALRSTYNILLRNPPSPAEVARALEQAETLNAVWPHGLWTLIEKALGRDRTRWYSPLNTRETNT
jgi:hypothetical protein